MVAAPPGASILALPTELVLAICALSAPRDIVCLLSTCKSLRATAKNESLWTELCARHGVCDITHFPARYRSFRAVYTRMVYAYGPLFGLWASDAPFKGGILQIRFEPGGADEHASIVGEHVAVRPVPGQRFDDEDEGLDEEELFGRFSWSPRIPRYVRTMRISFDNDDYTPKAALPEDAEGGGLGPAQTDTEMDVHTLPYAKMTCYRDSPHQSAITFGPTVPRHLLIHIPEHEHTPLTHPTFPHDGAPWLDHSRAFNKDIPWHFAQGQPPEPDFPSEDDVKHAIEDGPCVFSRPLELAPEDAPRALTFACGCYTHTSLDFGIPTLVGRPRWFPLRGSPPLPPSTGPDPASAWTPDALRGLWLGGYGPHGTEVQYLEHARLPPADTARPEDYADADREPAIRAWKVTGDANVPRGAPTWRAELIARLDEDELPEEVVDGFEEDAPLRDVFSGWGTISGAGFQSETLIPCFVAIINLNKIKVWWSMMNHCITYIRMEPWKPGMEARSRV